MANLFDLGGGPYSYRNEYNRIPNPALDTKRERNTKERGQLFSSR